MGNHVKKKERNEVTAKKLATSAYLIRPVELLNKRSERLVDCRVLVDRNSLVRAVSADNLEILGGELLRKSPRRSGLVGLLLLLLLLLVYAPVTPQNKENINEKLFSRSARCENVEKRAPSSSAVPRFSIAESISGWKKRCARS